MKKTLSSIVLSAFALFVLVPQVIAAGESNCQIIYGGGQVCAQAIKFTINKLVQSTGKGGEFVENLTINDSKFSAGQTINFKIVVTNTGSINITNLSVVDSFPQFIGFVSGAGNFDSNSKKLSFTVDSLNPGQSREFIVSGKVVNEELLPSNAGTTCVVNTVRATDNSGATADDSAQACIQRSAISTIPSPEVFKKVPTQQIPATGPELYSLVALIPTGIAGIMLRRKKIR